MPKKAPMLTLTLTLCPKNIVGRAPRLALVLRGAVMLEVMPWWWENVALMDQQVLDRLLQKIQ